MKKLQFLSMLCVSILFSNLSKAQVYPMQNTFVLSQNTYVDYNLYIQSHSIDQVNCMMYAQAEYQIIVNNSFMYDTVIVVYSNYSQKDTLVNMTSNTTFDVSAAMNNSSLFFTTGIAQQTSGMPNPPLFFPNSSIDKIIHMADTLDVHGVAPMINTTLSPNCTFSSVSGTAFIDSISNCSYDAVEEAISGQVVTYSANYTSGGTGGSLYVNTSGVFNNSEFKSDGFVNAIFTIPSVYNFAFNIPACSQMMYNINALPATNINFARECASNIDVSASIMSNVWPGARPITPFDLYPNVSNFGCQAASGVLELELDPNVTYDAVNSSNPADYTSGNSLFWNYANLTNVGVSNSGYWNQFIGGVRLTPNGTVNIGDTLVFTVHSSILLDDVDTLNNSQTIHIPIVNSYDPNFKEVIPKGSGAQGFIPNTTTSLTYTVHFQNTGTAPALNIHITDTLNSNVLPRTLRIIDASHNLSPVWLSNNVLDFKFNNINLPDSTSDEPNSHGFVSFKIDLQTGLADGTQITNKAYIYFDNNPAIITNAALNTIGEDQTASIQNYAGNLKLNVYPNPMNESTTFSVQNASSTHLMLKVYNSVGQIVKTLNANGTSKIILHRESLESGIYFYKIEDTETHFISNGRLVIE